MCLTDSDCQQRKKSAFGSSSFWPENIQGSELYSNDPKVNPDFATWNHIFIPYCSGDLWLGQSSLPVNPFLNATTELYYFQGHFIVETIVAHIKSASNPSNVLLTGCR